MKQAMIFAAGLGTRLKPLTNSMPKALVPVGGRPLLGHVVERLRNAGFEHIVINVHHFAQQIVDYVKAHDGWGMDVSISDETAQLLETGGGIKHARHLFDPDSPILIHNVDILSNADLAALYAEAQGNDATLLVSPRESSRALIFHPETMRLRGWTNLKNGEIKAPCGPIADTDRRLAFSGIHVFSPSLFPLMETWPEQFPIIDFYLSVCADHNLVGINQPDLSLIDVGKAETLAEANLFLNQL